MYYYCILEFQDNWMTDEPHWGNWIGFLLQWLTLLHGTRCPEVCLKGFEDWDAFYDQHMNSKVRNILRIWPYQSFVDKTNNYSSSLMTCWKYKIFSLPFRSISKVVPDRFYGGKFVPAFPSRRKSNALIQLYTSDLPKAPFNVSSPHVVSLLFCQTSFCKVDWNCCIEIFVVALTIP